MEFFGEVDFLSIIEEEHEDDEKSLQVEETDDQVSEKSEETQRNEEKRSSRIPVRLGRTSVTKRISDTNGNEVFSSGNTEDFSSSGSGGLPQFQVVTSSERCGDSSAVIEDEVDFIEYSIEGQQDREDGTKKNLLVLEELTDFVGQDDFSVVDVETSSEVCHRSSKNHLVGDNSNGTNEESGKNNDRHDLVDEDCTGKDVVMLEAQKLEFIYETNDRSTGYSNKDSETCETAEEEASLSAEDQKKLLDDESLLTSNDYYEKSHPDFNFPADVAKSDDSDELDHKPAPRHGFLSRNSSEISGNEAGPGAEDIDFRRTVSGFLLAELEVSSGNFYLASYSPDPAGTPLTCQEADEPILEAPAEFRTAPGRSELSVEVSDQAPPPAPLLAPEEDPPNRDHHNTNPTEAGDTTERSERAVENQLVDEGAQESAREHQASGTANASATFANSTEDNDHVELEGDNRNVSAFEHVGKDAPIQRHDMPQIDRRETAVPFRSTSEPCLTQCQIDRGCGGSDDVLKVETYDSRRRNCAGDLCGDSVENDSSFVPDGWILECEAGSLKIPDLLYGISDSGSSEDSSMSSVRNFSIEEFLDDVPEMFSDRYKFKFSAVLGDSLGGGEKVVGVQDNNNNFSRVNGLLDAKCSVGESLPTASLDLAVSTAPSSSASEGPRPRAPSDAHLCESRQPKAPSSIGSEARFPAPAPGRSPTKTAAPNGCVVSRQTIHPGCTSSAPEDREPVDVDGHGPKQPAAHDHQNHRESKSLRWSFKNGRLVFDSESDADENKAASAQDRDSLESGELRLSSKEINRRIDENKSRLRYLEEKLKKAGISDQTKRDKEDSTRADVAEQVVETSELKTEGEPADKDGDSRIDILEVNGNDVADYGEDYAEGLTSFTGGEEFCQFDVNQLGSFPAVLNGYCLVYDELNQATDSEEEFHVISFEEDADLDHQFYLISNKTTANMGTDSDRPKHNPDTENLKSLLKRPGRKRDKKSNRVVFNENKNEFFDADYIILIREECDYDDEDDDSVCTCNQHEMVRLTCCEPNCNCSVYEGFDPTPQSPKFAPPLEFVDAVTLSPPEGYKDMELEEQELFALQQMARRGQQRHAVCRECSATHDDNDEEGDSSPSDEGGGPHSDPEESGEREKTDQSQQTTPTTPENCTDDSNLHEFNLDRSSMTGTERSHPSEDERREDRPTPSVRLNVPVGGSPISGILKGGKLWKQPSLEGTTSGGPSNKTPELQQNTDSSATSDEEGSQRRFVRFIETESNGQRDGCDGASDDHTQDETNKEQSASENERTKQENCHNNVSPDTTEMMLTFKLGNHVLISNNSLKPNSAVRQLFPCTKPNAGKDEESIQQYLVTAESLRAFEEAKRSKLPQIIQSGETDESIKKAIERNTLRRSLIRYEPRSRKNQPKTDNSLVERIKKLTCDVDDVQAEQEDSESQTRASPPGEEARNSPEVTSLKQVDKSFSPSSSSTTSSNASSVSSTYKKITDLFSKKTEKPLDNQNNVVGNVVQEGRIAQTLPDLGNGPHEMEHPHLPASRINSSTNDSRKQFLASLAPLTACVSGITNIDDYYYQMNNHHPNHGGERASMASSVGTEYSLEDIDEALRNEQEDIKRITPDVLAGTPSASESGDELAMFVQQDAGRIERLKKRYQPEANKEEDDEHDDYGFNKRPSVRGIKPRFGTTTQIIQEIQNQMQPPEATGRISWPYYSESGLSNVDNSKSKNQNQNIPHQYPTTAPEEFKTRGYPPPYRPTSLAEENLYQTGQYCRQVYRTNGNSNAYPAVMKVGARCNEMYQSLPRQKSNGRPLSPPPSEVSRTYHQTMVYIPYNHIEGCQGGVSSNVYYQHSDYARVSNQNQINKRFIDPIYQQRFHMHVEDHHYHYNSSVMTSNPPKQMVRIPYTPQPHGANARSESPLPGQFSTAARATQTPVPNCNYYSNPRYRPAWQGDPTYVSKMNRHSFPLGPRYSTSDTSTDTDSCQGMPPVQNGYRQSVEISFPSQKDALGSSPTKPKFTERGVPEGAASVSPPDTIKLGQSNSSTMTSPTSPQNVTMQKPMFYAMNV
ncbi:uncharacterized protein LOC123312586 isoform X2 [Coccinella septempunctata]|uniref:uncharacterized protein LOC123312586 isoform X2 n=1 Tax=Coccinella septempunctata TaxID=41139 RepID=UPI001D07CD4C|nr:uncharacterized protein LOC123312586 isoform X2 [Coccinella septempunctata]